MRFVREGLAIAWSQPVATAATMLIVAAICAVIVSTAGQAAAAQARVLHEIDEVGTRIVVIDDRGGRAQMHPESVARLGAVDGVAWAVGFGPVVDVHNMVLGDAGRAVPARLFYGQLPEEIRQAGRQPGSGEAIAGEDAVGKLGLELAAGGVAGKDVAAPIVGSFRADEPFSFLQRSVLIAPNSQGGSSNLMLRQIYVGVAQIEDVEAVTRASRAVVSAEVPSELVIQTPQQLVDLRQVVESTLARDGRRLILLALSVGLIVVTTTLVGAVSQRRRDFGRRRALGASRSVIVLLVLVHTLAATLVGEAIGLVVGVIVVWRLAGSLPSLSFVVAVLVLALLASVVAAIPPGLLAAFRDPVRILRVP